MQLKIDRKRLVLVNTDYEDRMSIKAAAPGCRWHPSSRTWIIPLHDNAITNLRDTFGDRLKVDEKVNDFIRGMVQEWQTAITSDLDKHFNFTSKPYEHQRKAFSFLAALKNGAAFMEMGTGKTKVAIDVAQYYWENNKEESIDRILIVAPNSVIDVWPREIEKHGQNGISDPVILRGTKAKREKLYSDFINGRSSGKVGPSYAIINYEGILVLAKLMLKSPPDMLICDESSKLKNPQAKRSKALWHIGANTKRILLLSGTPITQNPFDIYSQYRVLDERIFGTSFVAFRARYAIMGGYEGYEVLKWINMNDFTERVYRIAFRATKAECLDLPPKIYEKRYCEMGPEQARRYKEIAKKLITEFEGEGRVTAAIALTKILRLSQITSGFLSLDEPELIDELDLLDDEEVRATDVAGGPVRKKERPIVELPENPKLDLLIEALEEIVPNSKIIIWARFRHDIFAIQKILESFKIKYSIVFGDIPAKARGKMVNDFQDDPSVRVFIGQIQTAGFGLTLHAANTVIYFSNTYSTEDRLQSEDRAHRIGQESNVTYIDLICSGTIDESVIEVVQNKRDFAEFVMDRSRIKSIIEGSLQTT